MRKFKLMITAAFVCHLMLAGALALAQSPVSVRAGHFPNMTHAQALVGRANRAFERALAPSANVSWKIFNAGPPVIEAIFAGQLDIAYVGPNPAINGYIRSEGEALRIIAGAASGGAALVVRDDSGIHRAADLHGRKVASPQLGNTQDVALRAWLKSHGLIPAERGGDVWVIPVANPDQITLFLRKQLDAAWAPEPWASRLIHEAGGRLLLDERTLWPNGRFVTTHLIVRADFLRQHSDVVLRWLRVHVELTEWIHQHPAEARAILNEEIRKETGKALPEKVLDDALSRLEFTYDPIPAALFQAANQAFEAGMLGRRKPDLRGIYNLGLLNRVLAEKELPPVQ